MNPLLIIRDAQMQAIAESLASDLRHTLTETIATAFMRRSQHTDAGEIAVQVERALQWSSGLRFPPPETIRFAEIVCRRFGGFPDGPLPKPMMKLLYRCGLSAEERLQQLERLEI